MSISFAFEHMLLTALMKRGNEKESGWLDLAYFGQLFLISLRASGKEMRSGMLSEIICFRVF